MGRARRSGFSLVLILLALTGLTAVTTARTVAAGAAAVTWPTSTLLVSELVTGGTSASDEFVELFNAGSTAVDLAGLDLVYATSSGSTVTSKASWTASLLLEPGRHVLVANAAGSYASLADATYTGGLSSTGGAVALRTAGGPVVDAIAWGEATSAFMEGTAAPAPPARSSLERLPGGAVGNGTDTNVNAADWVVQASPTPQNLAASPVMSPAPPPSASPSSSGSASPSPSAAPSASSSPTGTPAACGPSTSPVTTPAPSAAPSTTLGPSAAPSVGPTPSPSPGGGTIAIVDARAMPIGTKVHVRGVVTAEAGRLGSAVLLAIADETAGLIVHLTSGAGGSARGTELEIEGVLAAPYGQLELRPTTGGILDLGPGTIPEPLPILASQLGEAVEGGLVMVEVVIDTAAHHETNGTLTLDALDARSGVRLAIRADASSGIGTAELPRHAHARLVGIVGQRATRTGRLDGYRIWLRDRGDIVVTDPGASVSPAPGGSTTPAPTRPTVSIAQALLSQGDNVRVVGTVTAAGKLLDSNGRVIVIQDGTAAIAVRLPSGVPTPRVGVRLRVDGSVGRAYGAPRISATASSTVGAGTSMLPIAIHAAPGTAHEWRLIRLEGIVADVHKDGDRWRADIAIGSARILVTGLPAAGIPATSLVEGRRATVIGIVRRPYPTATDRRFAVVPRSAADVRLGVPVGAGGAGGPATGSGSGSASDPGADGGAGSTSGTGGAEAPGPPDIDIATLGEHRGELVRVGGIVTALEEHAFLLDDGTAIGRIVLSGDATTLLGLLSPGDALDAVGRVAGTGLAIEVARASEIVRVGDPGPGSSVLLSGDPADGRAAPAVAGEGRSSPLPDPAPGAPIAAVLIVLVGALATALAATFVLRRRREGRLAAGRIAVRLAAITGGRTERSGTVEPAPEAGV